MAGIGAAHGRALLDYSLNDGGTTYKIGLYLSNPTKDNSGTEASGGDYARQTISFGAASEVSNKQQVANDGAVDFGEQSTDLGEITHWAVFTSGGTFLYFGAFTQGKEVYSGDSFEIKSGEIIITLV